ncbi:PIR protein [Plasmodium yoelii]|uniref:PIR protein n=2 Tax=Plasmodium yoelii TaxID=5861 RepID=A0AAF0B5F7_PLAYO|nr:PIR protein [Plasmodium yoelii]WBY58289.1 PIR protein [Plasmodium yoelii yoelii]CDS44082.1 YIR protein [Plasmodium yoelii]VTZ79207.1 PIR protein [Plasmodium yoelii]|eukprot:XP_034493517.1 PIR protein [Plasmodium yoelii]
MDDTLCSNFDILRKHLPDELSEKAETDLENISNFKDYCPGEDCNTELEQITIGFLWLLGKYFIKYPSKGNTENDTKPFFLYIILWLSYKLSQNSENSTTKINEFYTKHVNDNSKYSKFINDSSRFTDLKKFIDKQNYLLNINIKDLSKFYDVSKLICSMYGNVAMGKDSNILLNNANEFVSKYQELSKNYNNTDGSSYKQILTALSTDYNKLKNKNSSITPLPEITADVSAYISRVRSSSSSTGKKLFTVLSIFGAIAFFLGISYKYSLFGFRKRAQKQYLREKIKKIKKKMNH